MANEIVEIIRESLQVITRKAFISVPSDLLRPIKDKNGTESAEAFTERQHAGIEEAIAEGKAKWRGEPNYGEEKAEGKILFVGRVNPTEFKMRTQAETNALSEARKDRVKADKEAKTEK